ncbi:MAG TPA: polyphosphate kinase 2 family protein [Gammaproteobacteria bacterium]|nr:polyphosphate kinase 2 family protein [Gammaproteobacteria bacterium]
MFTQFPRRHRVSFVGDFHLAQAQTAPSPVDSNKILKKKLKKLSKQLYELQRALYAEDQRSLLLVFQAMDAAGKDSTIRSVMRGVNPAGCQVHSFKQPSAEELDHDFLWRSSQRLPQRGRIGIFNRSYYEEVLVVRVHPEYLGAQKLPGEINTHAFWEERYESIRSHEQHLARNGTVVIKFWLNVSQDAQKARFLSRLNEPEKNWKFSAGDLKERTFWQQYMDAYAMALNQTSRPWAPWYAIPADNKLAMRVEVAETIVATLSAMNPAYPQVAANTREQFAKIRQQLLTGD